MGASPHQCEWTQADGRLPFIRFFALIPFLVVLPVSAMQPLALLPEFQAIYGSNALPAIDNSYQ